MRYNGITMHGLIFDIRVDPSDHTVVLHLKPDTKKN